MPVLDAIALDTDPEGAAILRTVIESGRRGRRLPIDAFLRNGEARPVDPLRRVSVLVERELETKAPLALLAAAS